MSNENVARQNKYKDNYAIALNKRGAYPYSITGYYKADQNIGDLKANLSLPFVIAAYRAAVTENKMLRIFYMHV